MKLSKSFQHISVKWGTNRLLMWKPALIMASCTFFPHAMAAIKLVIEKTSFRVVVAWHLQKA
jgi:hypothetical protein